MGGLRNIIDWLLAKLRLRVRSTTSQSDTPQPECNWCLVGNIVDQHPFGTEQEIRRGSKHFSAGTKVYCLPAQWGDGYEKVVAVGIERHSRRLITVVMPSEQITNWRATVVYKPAVLKRLRRGFEHFNHQWRTEREVKEYADYLTQRPLSGR